MLISFVLYDKAKVILFYLNKKFFLIKFNYICRNIAIMPIKKDTRGRKGLPASEKKHPITIFVKRKNHAKATTECKTIERKYNTK